MYPETDIPPSSITADLLEKIRSNLPEPAEKKLVRLMNEYNLNEKLAKQLIDSDYGAIFEVIAKESGVAATAIAAFLTETVKALKREGFQVEIVTDEKLQEIFHGVGSGLLAKEAVPEVFSWLSAHENGTLKDALESLGLKMFSNSEIEQLIERIINENKLSTEKSGVSKFGLFMGLVMKEARGKADPAIVSRFLKERLR
jgi:glutamyl-tRNA(Gln) amidotransferase subunit E